jgi:hypothetical protein
MIAMSSSMDVGPFTHAQYDTLQVLRQNECIYEVSIACTLQAQKRSTSATRTSILRDPGDDSGALVQCVLDLPTMAHAARLSYRMSTARMMIRSSVTTLMVMY